MQRDAPFLSGEIYHVYNRGANKADIFLETSDYSRFKFLLFLANSLEPCPIRDTLKKYKAQGRSLSGVFVNERPDQMLVDVIAYALLPNHFHLILRQKSENGITKFMKKVATAYSMYFNTLYGHSGTVFQGRFKSKHVGEGDYLRWLCAYVALNPLDIGFPGWKESGVPISQAKEYLYTYQHASFPDLCPDTVKRPESSIISFDVIKELKEDIPDFRDVNTLFEVERNQINEEVNSYPQ